MPIQLITENMIKQFTERSRAIVHSKAYRVELTSYKEILKNTTR